MANTQINIGANGTTTLATAGKFCDRNIDVNVAVPASGITPTGTKTITTNGEHDVTNFAKANVNVPVGVTPSGTKQITTNGTHDVTNYANAQVDVPVGITPSGSKTITENGTHDVTNYASAIVAIPEKCVSFVLDVTTQLGNTSATTHTIKTGNAFAKAHYTHNDFKAFLMALYTVPNDVGAVAVIAQGNVDITSATSTNATAYGVRGWHSAAATFAFAVIPTAAKGNASVSSFRFNSAGDIQIYLPAKMYLPVGRYLVTLACGCQ